MKLGSLEDMKLRIWDEWMISMIGCKDENILVWMEDDCMAGWFKNEKDRIKKYIGESGKDSKKVACPLLCPFYVPS